MRRFGVVTRTLLIIGVLCGILVSPASATFGVETFELTANNQDGSADVTAGSHPWAVNTDLALNTTTDLHGMTIPADSLKDIEIDLPEGLVGDPSATPKCTLQQFTTQNQKISFLSGASCPNDTQVGVVGLKVSGFFFPLHLGIYNLVPPPGVPAEFGFNPVGIPIVLVPSVRTGTDNGITISVKNASQVLDVLGFEATFWGTPADASHDGARGECLSIIVGETEEKCPSGITPKPFLTMPTSCSGSALQTVIHVDSWQNPGVPVTAAAIDHDPSGVSAIMSGCEKLDFRPTLIVAPDTETANTPTGLSVDLRLPQSAEANGLAEADLKKVELQLPVGMAVSPSAVNGLAACSPEQISIGGSTPVHCPQASKIGSVEIDTPLLEEPLEGSVYVAEQEQNPFHSLLALYIVAEGDGVLLKLAGEVQADGETGRLTNVIDDAPQLPFNDLKLHLFGGPRATLVTPPSCGRYEIASMLSPWSTGMPVVQSSSFQIAGGCGGGFAPAFTAGMSNNEGGAFSPFTVTIERGDEDQPLSGVQVEMPPGLLGMLSKVQLCTKTQAAESNCPEASQIGHVIVGAGPGPDPVFLPQAGRAPDPVYLTESYEDAPFGLLIREHVEAGPFDLGMVSVRAAISVDPHTAQITIHTDPLPTILKGIPLQVRAIHVDVERPNGAEFTFNPTNCDPLAVNGTITSTHGVGVTIAKHFQAVNCATLTFKPKFTVDTGARATKKNGASLDVKVSYPSRGEANIHRIAVSLPKQLPSRLTTIQKACPEATFNANPASCPEGSDVGSAKGVTPVLNAPLTGPAYLVSHGGAAFPDLVMVLQGQGVTLDLVGSINISKAGITSSVFASVPDAPIRSFELKLPTSPHSALTANLAQKAKGSFCGRKLVMPTTIVGQNGAQINQSTKITITGCRTKHTVKRQHKAKHGHHRKK